MAQTWHHQMFDAERWDVQATPLAVARRRALARLGELVRVRRLGGAAAPSGGRGPTEIVPWPGAAVGCGWLVRTPRSVIVVTDGLSDAWDRGLHPDPPPWRFGLELAYELPAGEASVDAVQCAWRLLGAVVSTLVGNRVDLRRRVERHRCVTMGVPPVAGLSGWATDDGHVGLLVGVPFTGGELGTHHVIARDAATSVWLLPVHLLHPADYAWARAVPDASRALALAHGRLSAPHVYSHAP